MTTTAVNWTEMANKLVEEGKTRRDRPWELMLDKHLREFFPLLVTEMGEAYPDYLTVKVSQALDLQQFLVLEKGMDPYEARAEVLRELLPDLQEPEDPEVEAELKEIEAEEFQTYLEAMGKPSGS
jgi:hypothetical protein